MTDKRITATMNLTADEWYFVSHALDSLKYSLISDYLDYDNTKKLTAMVARIRMQMPEERLYALE